MNTDILNIYKSPTKFIKVCDYVSQYFYNLSINKPIPNINDTLMDFNDIEKENVNNLIKNIEKENIKYEIVLKIINNKIVNYYSKSITSKSTKSRNILNQWRNESLISDLSYIKTKKNAIDNKINSSLAIINIDNISYADKLKALSKNTNPYDGFSRTIIKQIDIKLHNKILILNLINNANTNFKKSNFRKALIQYEKAIVSLHNINNFENIHLYFYSWILHQLGNLHYAVGQTEESNSLFLDSYRTKLTIEKLPKAFIYSTQLKILGLPSYKPKLNENWDENLFLLQDKIKNTPIENDLYHSNLLTDVNFFLYNGYMINGNRNKAKKYFTISKDLAIQNKDFSNLVRLEFSHFMENPTQKSLDILDITLRQGNQIQKKDPYLTTLFRRNQNTLNLIDINKKKELIKIFENNNIEQIPTTVNMGS